MEDTAKSFYIPNVISNWPWPRTINSQYKSVKIGSNAYVRSYRAFNEKSQFAFDTCDLLSSASCFSSVSRGKKDALRIGCDYMILVLVIDEYTDVEPETVAREMVDIIMDALHNTHKPRPQGEMALGEMTRQFWELTTKTATESSQRHFIESFSAYLNCVVQQAADRDTKIIRSIDAYFENRREDCGTRPSFSPLEFELNLPDDVFYHAIMVELTVNTSDMVFLLNDIVSYNREQASGNPNQNIVTVVMHQLSTDINGAINWVADYHRETQRKFLDGLKRVPSWNQEIDLQVQQYLNGLANWVRANECWSFEAGRYFGSKGSEYKKTRLVPLLPRIKPVQDELSARRENTMVYLVDELESR